MVVSGAVAASAVIGGGEYCGIARAFLGAAVLTSVAVAWSSVRRTVAGWALCCVALVGPGVQVMATEHSGSLGFGFVVSMAVVTVLMLSLEFARRGLAAALQEAVMGGRQRGGTWN